MLDARRLARNFLSAGSMRLVAAGLSFFLFLVIARFHGKELLGEFATVFAFFIFLQQAPLLGLHVVVIREVASDPISLPRHATNGTILALVAAVLLCLGLGGTGHLVYTGAKAGLQPALWLVGLAMFPTALIVVVESILVGQERVGLMAIVNAAENLIRVVGSLAALYFGLGLTGIFAAFLIGRLAAAHVYFWHAGLKDSFARKEFAPAALALYLRECPTFLGILVLSSGINRLDSILISILATLPDAGVYAAGYKLYEICLMVPSILTFILFPTFARYFEADRAKFDQLARHLFRFCVVVGIPFSIAIAAHAGPIVTAIYRPELAPAAVVLRLLIFVPVIVGLDQILTMVLLAAKRQKLDLGVLALSCSSYLALLWILVPRFSYVGAAWATLLVALIQLGVRYLMVRRALGIADLIAALARPLAAASAMAGAMAATWTLPGPSALALGVGGYILATKLVGAVTRSDREVFGAAFAAREQAAT